MKARSSSCWFPLSLLLAGASVPFGQGANYSQNFDVNDTANWTVNQGPGINNANFFFDYSTLGIGSAPNSTGGTTRGLRLQANALPPAGGGAGTFGGLSVSPNGRSFTTPYRLDFDFWLNYNGPGPAGGNGTTQLAGAGVGTAGILPQWAGFADSIYFVTTLDGGSGSDYRGYSPVAATSYAATSGVYAAGNVATSNNNTDPYYSSFTAVALPAAQTALFPQQTGSIMPGTLGFGWHAGRILVSGGQAVYSIDGKTIATVSLADDAIPGTNILFNHFDSNAGASTDPNAGALLFSLFDNVRVLEIPEPTGVALAVTALLIPALRRRRR